MYIIESLLWLLPKISRQATWKAMIIKDGIISPCTRGFTNDMTESCCVGVLTEVRGPNRETHSLLRAVCCLGCRLFPPPLTRWDPAGASTWVSICLHLHRYLLWGSALTSPYECSSVHYFSSWWRVALSEVQWTTLLFSNFRCKKFCCAILGRSVWKFTHTVAL